MYNFRLALTLTMVRGRGLAWEENQDAFVMENLNMTAAIVHCFEYPHSPGPGEGGINGFKLTT